MATRPPFATLFQYLVFRVSSDSDLGSEANAGGRAGTGNRWCGRRPGSIIPTRGCHHLIYTVCAIRALLRRSLRQQKKNSGAEEPWPMLEFRRRGAPERRWRRRQRPDRWPTCRHPAGTAAGVVRGIGLQELCTGAGGPARRAASAPSNPALHRVLLYLEGTSGARP